MARCYPLSRAAPQSTPQEPTPAVASPKVSVFGANVAYCQTSHPRKGYSMLPLPIEFEDRLFRYVQVEREDDVAIFTQTHKASGHVRFEVVRIRVQARTHVAHRGHHAGEGSLPREYRVGTVGTYLLHPGGSPGAGRDVAAAARRPRAA